MSSGNYHRIASRTDIDPEEFLVCPYDPIHRVASKRFPYHIMKCKKNHPTKRMDTCPFNARHIIEHHLFRHHICNCPDKAVIENDIIHQQGIGSSGSLFKGNTDVPPYHNPEWEMPEPEENWDLDENQTHMYGSNNVQPSTMSVDWMTNAERKRYHNNLIEEARRRAQGLPVQPEEDRPQNDKPLRLPKETPMVLQQQKQVEKTGADKIAANIFGDDNDEKNGIVPTENMFLKASYNIASLYTLDKKPATNSVLGQVAKTAATHALLEELQKSSNSLSAPPPRMSQVTEDLPVATTLALTPMHYVANTDTQTAPMNYAMAISNRSTEVVPRRSSSTPDGTSVFVSAGLGRGRGRGIMDLLKRPGGNISHIGGKKFATNEAIGVQQSIGVRQVQPYVEPLSMTETCTQNISVNSALPTDVLSDVQLQERKEAEKEATKKKKVRKLNKKLKQITLLEQKKSEGGDLNEEEVNKVSKKDRLIEKLSSLTGLDKTWILSPVYIEKI
ncbi:uncharacterized protein LOC102800775 [Saccoglossus kowalevskii]|uniref:Uncharacterized protein LOC102800775 n=1 Tax=Saccoglossus kowalevskii TaxID=10224 RepID=A0ABM0MF39_SACKO|nr:PREDICTED: uncharacterized protein LOC102800775 [Saccoglossus kowalevskii]